VKVGDLVRDKHYGVGCIVGMDSSARGEWVKASFPKFHWLTQRGVITLWNEHVRELKVISKK
jgi:hypothetical protein